MKKDCSILIVDDERFNLILFDRIFSKKYTVYKAISGEEALKVIEEHEDIDLVISDMNMPGLNGVEFIEKAKPNHPNIEYFILTGYEINQEIKQALKSGLIQNYFQKPFEPKIIEEICEQVLSKKE